MQSKEHISWTKAHASHALDYWVVYKQRPNSTNKLSVELVLCGPFKHADASIETSDERMDESRGGLISDCDVLVESKIYFFMGKKESCSLC